MPVRIQNADVAEFEVVCVIDQPGSEHQAALCPGRTDNGIGQVNAWYVHGCHAVAYSR